MSAFTSPLQYEDTGKKWQGRSVYRLTEPFTYHISHLGSNVIVMAPSGFETDFASIPRIIRWFFRPRGRYAKAAVIHDLLYVTHETSREFADYVFLEGMGVLNVPSLTRHFIWATVRLGGARGWKRDFERQVIVDGQVISITSSKTSTPKVDGQEQSGSVSALWPADTD